MVHLWKIRSSPSSNLLDMRGTSDFLREKQQRGPEFIEIQFPPTCSENGALNYVQLKILLLTPLSLWVRYISFIVMTTNGCLTIFIIVGENNSYFWRYTSLILEALKRSLSNSASQTLLRTRINFGGILCK